MVCSSEGNKSDVTDGHNEVQIGTDKAKRRSSSCRTGCRAMIQFRWKARVGFVVTQFVDGHNHRLVSGGYRCHMKNYRNVDIGHQVFVAKCAKANIGPARSFRIFKELVGGYDEVGCRKVDFKNLSRDIKLYADEIDAKLLLDKFGRKHENNKEFFFDYCVDDMKRLTRLFWADPVSVENYKIFGDAVSFDATYQTNRYELIFTPFTGRDNHGKCVTFGAGLISQEDAESYGWLLSKFVECMGSPPLMLITDQDLGLRAAIPKVLPDTRHRFCLWHIMMKVPEKLPADLRGDEEFSKRFKQMVYSNTDEPLDFEKKWLEMMTDFGLLGNKWFEEMYELRTHWIQAYFRDIPMSGLFRTTLLSESENSFFKLFFKKNANLSHLYMLFEGAMESQRDDHDCLTLADETRTPDLRTMLEMERHAASVYTSKIFFEVQKEIEAAIMFCTFKEDPDKTGIENRYKVDEDAGVRFIVEYDNDQDYISCSCKMFKMKGLVCRHMFAIMKNMKYKFIPDKYIVKRWTKKACSIFDGIGQNRYALGMGNMSSCSQGLFGLAYKCVGISEGNDKMTEELTQILNEVLDNHSSSDATESQSNGKQNIMEQLYDAPNKEGNDVRKPKNSKTKGKLQYYSGKKGGRRREGK